MFISTRTISLAISATALFCTLVLFGQTAVSGESTGDGFHLTGNETLIPAGDLEPEAEDGTYLGSAVLEQAVFSSYTVRNPANSPLTITAIQILNNAKEGFFLVDDEIEFPVIVAPGGTFVFQIGFAPQSTGLQQAEILVRTAQGDYPFAVAANGLATGGVDPGAPVPATTVSPNLMSTIAAINSAAGLGGSRGFTPQPDVDLPSAPDDDDDADQDTSPPRRPIISP